MKKLFALLLALAVLFPMLPCKALANGLFDVNVKQSVRENDTAAASSESQALQCTAEPEPGPDVRAIEGTYENLKYSIEDGEVTITGYVNEPAGALTIPETIEGYPVTGIGYRPFYDCDFLTSVEMPNVHTIGYRAFYDCDSLTSVEMPNVKEVVGSSFYGTAWYDNLTDEFAVFGDGVLVKYCGTAKEVMIPDNVKYVAGFYRNANITSVSMTESQVICRAAFFECTSLISVKMPNVETIGREAFFNCTSLESVKMPNVKTIGDYAFYNCRALTSVKMPNVKTIGALAFYYCGSLTSLEMPNVHTIEESAFSYSSITSLAMPNVETIGEYAFSNCKSLTSVEMQNVETIGEYAFSNCKSLTSVEMPNVQTIGDSAFMYCSSLTSAYFYSDAPTSFGTKVFYKCASGFTIYYANGTSGWTTPTWNGYPTQEFEPTNIAPTEMPKEAGCVYVAERDTLYPVDGATVKIKSNEHGTYTVQTVNGYAFFEGVPDGKYSVDIEKEGYIGILGVFSIQKNSLTTICINKAAEDVPDEQQEAFGITCNGQDILNHAVKYKSTEDVDLTINITAFANASRVARYCLLQSGSEICGSESGTMVLSAKDIKPGETVWMRAEYNDGTQSKAYKTYLSTYNTLFNVQSETEVSFMDGKLEFTYPNDGSIFSGRKFEFDLGYCPVSAKIEDDGSVKVGFGTKNLFDRDGDELFKKLKQSTINQELDSALNALMCTAFGTVSFGFEAKPEINVFGFAEGKVDENGEFAICGGEVVVKVKIKVKNNWQTVIWVLPVTASLEVAVSGEMTVKIRYEDGFAFDGIFKIGAQIEAAGALGIAEIANAGIYGSVGGEYSYDTEKAYAQVKIDGEFGAKGVLFFMEQKWPWWSGTKVIWEGYMNKGNSKVNTYDYKMGNIYDTSGYTLSTREYLATQSDWNGALVKDTGEMTTLQSDIYYNTNVKTVAIGQKKIMVWLADDGTRTAGNHVALVYSVFDNGAWTEPEYVYDDGTADFYPQLATDGDEVFVTWQNMNMTFDENVTIEQLCAAGEIAYAQFDAKTNKFVNAKNITSNALLDIQPQIVVSNGIPTIVWSQNADNELWSGENTILYSVNGGEAQRFVTVNTTIMSLAVGMLGGKTAIAYTADTDGELSTTDNDAQLYCGFIGGDPYAIEDKGTANASFYSIGGKNALCFMFDGTVCYTFDGTVIYRIDNADDLPVGDDFTIASDGNYTFLVFMHNEDDRGVLYCRKFDKNTSTWSKSVRLTDNTGYIESINALVNGDGSLTLVFIRSDVVMSEGNMDISTDLCEMQYTSNTNIVVNGVTFEQDAAIPGATLPVTVGISNAGTETVEKIAVTVTADGVDAYTAEITTNLLPGASDSYSFEYTMPDAFVGREYTFSVEPVGSTDSNMLDNTISKIMEFADLSISVEKIIADGTNAVIVTISNIGNIPTDAKLIITSTSADGSSLGAMQYVTDILAPGATVVINLNDAAIRDVCNNRDSTIHFSVEVNNNYAESNIGDNDAYVSILPENDYIYYDVTFVDGVTGETLSCQKLFRTTNATLPTPPEHEGYTFTGWDSDGTNITADTTITALYEINTYTVTYLDSITGEVISTATVEHGADAVFPTPPEHEGYTFTGWDSDGTNITADTTITALYEETVTVLQGDANGDGVINGKDVTLIRRYITGGYDVEVILEAADINGDGVINGKDITLLRRLIVGGYGDVA